MRMLRLTGLPSAPVRLVAAALALALGACGPSGDTGPGRVSVHLVDGPGEYAEVNLDVQRVEIHTSDGWRTLGTPNVTVDLLTLVDGVAATLVEEAVIDAGHYTQLRLVLGPHNTVKLHDGSVHDLKVPSGMQSGVKLTASFDVAPNTTADLFIDFDAHRSVFVHEAGNSSKYIMRPTVRAVERVVTGAIAGTLSDASGPLAGVEVTAQVLDAAGNPQIVRSATTAVDGSYVLDLLPVGASYHVVSQPVVRVAGAPVAVYDAKASGPVAVTEAAPTPSAHLTFTPISGAPGSLAWSVVPPATEADADLVSVLQTFDFGGVPRTFVVRTGTASVVAGVAGGLVDALPAGSYDATLTRRTLSPVDGSETVVTSAPVPVEITAGDVPTPVLFTVP